MNRPLFTSILVALFLLATILACSKEREPRPEWGYGIDGSGRNFYCGSGPVGEMQSDGLHVKLSDNSLVEVGHSYATTEPGGKGVCIRPPTPSPSP